MDPSPLATAASHAIPLQAAIHAVPHAVLDLLGMLSRLARMGCTLCLALASQVSLESKLGTYLVSECHRDLLGTVTFTVPCHLHGIKPARKHTLFLEVMGQERPWARV